MIKFEEHYGMIFRMLESPVPLTPDAEMPCLVRLIQDDSPMGRYNQSYSEYKYGVRLGCCMIPIIATHIAKNGVVNDIEWDVSRYEIIGTPVAEGSAEWRNYQLMQGKCVCRPGDSEYYQASGQGRIIGKLIENNEFNSTWNSNTFMRDDSDGWQIYKEPEPQPAYAVGDNVEVNVNGEMRQGKLVRFCSADFMQDNPDAFVLHDFFGRWYGYHRVADITRKLAPADVVIHIGCMSGTVKRWDSTTFHMFHGNSKFSKIHIDALDAPTRELVESLLKAQEEK